MFSGHLLLVSGLLGHLPVMQAASAVTMPWVGYSSEGNVWEHWQGELAGEHDDSTTYHIQPDCTPSAKTHCETLDPPITLILATSSYELITTSPNGFEGYQSSSCALTGSPSPTKAHCYWTNSQVFRGSTDQSSETMNVPPDSLHDYEIFQVTLTLGSPAATSATATSAAASSTSETTGTGSTTHVTVGPSITTSSGSIGSKTAAPILALGGILVGAVFMA